MVKSWHSGTAHSGRCFILGARGTHPDSVVKDELYMLSEIAEKIKAEL